MSLDDFKNSDFKKNCMNTKKILISNSKSFIYTIYKNSNAKFSSKFINLQHVKYKKSFLRSKIVQQITNLYIIFQNIRNYCETHFVIYQLFITLSQEEEKEEKKKRKTA